jgi:hypothetical protein
MSIAARMVLVQAAHGMHVRPMLPTLPTLPFLSGKVAVAVPVGFDNLYRAVPRGRLIVKDGQNGWMSGVIDQDSRSMVLFW